MYRRKVKNEEIFGYQQMVDSSWCHIESEKTQGKSEHLTLIKIDINILTNGEQTEKRLRKWTLSNPDSNSVAKYASFIIL